MSDAISLDRVTKRYGRTTAVRELSLTVGAGEMFGLIGPDGAGKTTTIRLICGLLKADQGRVRVLGLRDTLVSIPGLKRLRGSAVGTLTVGNNKTSSIEEAEISRMLPQVSTSPSTVV